MSDIVFALPSWAVWLLVGIPLYICVLVFVVALCKAAADISTEWTPTSRRTDDPS